jgi:hypothetical protein
VAGLLGTDDETTTFEVLERLAARGKLSRANVSAGFVPEMHTIRFVAYFWRP